MLGRQIRRDSLFSGCGEASGWKIHVARGSAIWTILLLDGYGFL